MARRYWPGENALGKRFSRGLPPEEGFTVVGVVADAKMTSLERTPPLMVYLPFIVLLAQRYKKQAGVGTVVSLMIPYTIIVAVAWILFFVVWYLIGIPLGPGAGVHL